MPTGTLPDSLAPHRRFLERLERYFGLSGVTYREDAATPDIAAMPAQQAILIGRRWHRAQRPEQQKRLLHEAAHLWGMPHNAATRRLGYFSSPARDVWSKRVYNDMMAKLLIGEETTFDPVRFAVGADLGVRPPSPPAGRSHRTAPTGNPATPRGQVPVAAIVTSSANQPRAGLDEANVQRLVRSFDPKRLTPIEVRRIRGGQYELIHGHHRFEAARRLGLTTLPARILRVSQREARRIAEEANLSGKTLTPVEMAQVAARRLKAGESPADIVGAMPGLGLKAAQVEDYARIVKLPRAALTAVDDPVLSRRFTVQHALALARAQELYRMPVSEVQAFFNQVVMQSDMSATQMGHLLETYAPRTQQRRAEQGTLFGKGGFGGNYTGIMARIREAGQQIKDLQATDHRLGAIERYIDDGNRVPRKLADALKAVQRERKALQAEIERSQQALAGHLAANPVLSGVEGPATEAQLRRQMKRYEADVQQLMLAFDGLPDFRRFARTLSPEEELAVNQGRMPYDVGQGHLLNPTGAAEARVAANNTEITRLNAEVQRELRALRPIGVMSELGAVMGVQPKRGVMVQVPGYSTPVVFARDRQPTSEQIRHWGEALANVQRLYQDNAHLTGFAVIPDNRTIGNRRYLEQGLELKKQGLLTTVETAFLGKLQRFWKAHPDARGGVVRKGAIEALDYNPVAISYAGSGVSGTEAELLAQVAQGKATFSGSAETKTLGAMDRKSLVALRYRPTGAAKVELLPKGRAWLERHAPAALESFSDQGPVGRAVGPLHQDLVAQELQAAKAVAKLSPEERRQMVGTLPIQAQMSDQAMEELITAALLSGQAVEDLPSQQRTAWQRISAAALKRAHLEGLPPSVARETLKAIARKYREIRGYDPMKHNPEAENPTDLAFMKYNGPVASWWDWGVERTRRIKPGSVVIADKSDLGQSSVPVITRGKGFTIDLRRRDLEKVPSFTPPPSDRGTAGQLMVSGKDARSLRQYGMEAKGYRSGPGAALNPLAGPVRVMRHFRLPFVWKGNKERQTVGEEYWWKKHPDGTLEAYQVEEHGWTVYPGKPHTFNATQFFYHPGDWMHSNGQFVSGLHDYDNSIAKKLRKAGFKRSRTMPEREYPQAASPAAAKKRTVRMKPNPASTARCPDCNALLSIPSGFRRGRCPDCDALVSVATP